MSFEKQSEFEVQQGEVNKKLVEIRRLGKVIFQTQEGKLFLENLKQLYLIEQPVSPSWVTDRAACIREGQNEIIRMLLTMGDFIR